MREVYRGRVWAVRPMTVVRDTPELIALYMPAGTPWKRPVSPATGERLRLQHEDWRLADDVWVDHDTLHLVAPDAAHAVLAFWTAPGREFATWYVNLQEPLRRTPIGFDYLDQALDIVVAPDLTWQWKDEDELRDAERLGILTPQEAEAVRREADGVVSRIEARAFPFDSDWPAWKPDPAWPIPHLAASWDSV